MIKDLSAKLVAAAAEINKKSREAYVAEQRTLAEKVAKKEMKMPGVPEPKADPAASAGTDKMVKTKVTEEAGSTPKTPREKELAAMSGNKKKITFGDVLKARGVKMKEEAEPVEEATLSAKAARAGKDIGEPGKNFSKIAASAAKRYGSAEAGKRVAGAILKKMRMKEEAEPVEEGMVKDMAKKAVKVLTGGSDKDQLKDLQKKMGMPQTGEKPMKEGVTNAFDWKNTPSQIPKKPGELTGHEAKKTEKGVQYTKKPVKENMDTPGNSTHQCAVHVKSEQFGEGRTLTSQHAVPDELGNVAWYDVMFAEGIKRVETKDLEVLVTEDHMNHPMKKKKAK